MRMGKSDAAAARGDTRKDSGPDARREAENTRADLEEEARHRTPKKALLRIGA